jgi:hypothetical protein
MILSTHAVVGGAIASLLPSHPVFAVFAAFASHFVIDAIPHWDYSLGSIAIGKGADNRGLRLSRGVLIDLTKIVFDACAGLVLALWLFATPASIWVVGLAACAAMLPDPLQFVHSLSPREPLKTLQRFHSWIHSKRKLAWGLGVSSQIAFASAVSALAVAIN